MATSLQMMKTWSELESNPLYWFHFTVNYKGSWYWDRLFSHKPFRKWRHLDLYYKEIYNGY